jgi:hypothetical protein
MSIAGSSSIRHLEDVAIVVHLHDLAGGVLLILDAEDVGEDVRPVDGCAVDFRRVNAERFLGPLEIGEREGPPPPTATIPGGCSRRYRKRATSCTQNATVRGAVRADSAAGSSSGPARQ